MKNPDILILLVIIVLLGAGLTSVISEPDRSSELMTLENSIR